MNNINKNLNITEVLNNMDIKTVEEIINELDIKIEKELKTNKYYTGFINVFNNYCQRAGVYWGNEAIRAKDSVLNKVLNSYKNKQKRENTKRLILYYCLERNTALAIKSIYNRIQGNKELARKNYYDQIQQIFNVLAESYNRIQTSEMYEDENNDIEFSNNSILWHFLGKNTGVSCDPFYEAKPYDETELKVVKKLQSYTPSLWREVADEYERYQLQVCETVYQDYEDNEDSIEDGEDTCVLERYYYQDIINIFKDNVIIDSVHSLIYWETQLTNNLKSELYVVLHEFKHDENKIYQTQAIIRALVCREILDYVRKILKRIEARDWNQAPKKETKLNTIKEQEEQEQQSTTVKEYNYGIL